MKGRASWVYALRMAFDYEVTEYWGVGKVPGRDEAGEVSPTLVEYVAAMAHDGRKQVLK